MEAAALAVILFAYCQNLIDQRQNYLPIHTCNSTENRPTPSTTRGGPQRA